MAKYKVRANFVVHLVGGASYGPGEIVELTAEQAEVHAVQIEPAKDPLDHDGNGRKGGSMPRKGKASAE